MKKIITLALAFALAMSVTVTAFAAEIQEDNTNPVVDTAVSYSVAPTYTVTIPASVTVVFNAQTTDFGSVEVSAAQLDPDKCVKVSLKSNGELKNDKTKVIPYTVKSGNSVYTSATYLKSGDKDDLTINISADDWNKAYAGDYKDTVTFEVAYVNK